jgi:hypothetical protein
MIIEIFEVDSPNQKYPLFFSTRDIVSMNSNTGEVHFQRGGFDRAFRLSTEKFERILDHWRLNEVE